jgi:hypothetical protein
MAAALILEIIALYSVFVPLTQPLDQPFDLHNFQLVPYTDCCYYYDAMGVQLEPGNTITGQVVFQYSNGFPGKQPSFFLVSASQMNSQNARLGFPDRYNEPVLSNVTSIPARMSIIMDFYYDGIKEKSTHYFVLLPQLQDVGFARMEVRGDIHSTVPSNLPVIAGLVAAIIGTGIAIADSLKGTFQFRRSQQKQSDGMQTRREANELTPFCLENRYCFGA